MESITDVFINGLKSIINNKVLFVPAFILALVATIYSTSNEIIASFVLPSLANI